MSDKERFIEFLKSVGFKEVDKDLYGLEKDEYTCYKDCVTIGHGDASSGGQTYHWFVYTESGKYKSHGTHVYGED